MIAAAVIAAAAAATLAPDAGVERVAARAKACIANNAVEVERAEASLSTAADFLIEDVCAVPVSVLWRYRASLQALTIGRRGETYGDYMADMNEYGAKNDPQALTRYKEREAKRRQMYARATISEETGELITPGSEQPTNLFVIPAIASQMVEPELRAAAAKALLDARRARQGR